MQMDIHAMFPKGQVVREQCAEIVCFFLKSFVIYEGLDKNV